MSASGGHRARTNMLTITVTQTVDQLTTVRIKETDDAFIATTNHPRSSQNCGDLQGYMDSNCMFESFCQPKRRQGVSVNSILQIADKDGLVIMRKCRKTSTRFVSQLRGETAETHILVGSFCDHN